MFGYVFRRLLQAVLVLVAASFVVYVLAGYSGDPLSDLRTVRESNREVLIARRIEMLDLNTPPALRFFGWAAGAVGCLAPGIASCDLGRSIQGEQVTSLLISAMAQTIQLVTAATVLAIVIGIALGIISALRQYSPLDYGITFMAFLFFSLPVFWIAVLLKEFGAIKFNDFLRDPKFSLLTVVIVAAIAGLMFYFASYGALPTRLLVAAAAAAVVAGAMFAISATGWLLTPALGLGGVLVLGLLIAVGVVYLSAGLRNRRALYSALATVVVGAVLYFPIQPLLNRMTGLLMVGLAVVCVLVGLLIGWLFGGYDRGQGMRAAALTAFLVGLLIVTDRFMQSWPAYVTNVDVRGRPIPTVGSRTPGFDELFWLTATDRITHLILPTAALMLVALAGYSRYSRASMLEIMNMDYIRTARAKGVSERSVVMKHAFRNALIPLATLIAFDIGGLIGGAVITETVFAFTGMGNLFVASLRIVDLNPIMGVFLVTGLVAMVFNLIADLLYAVLDPRVRVKA